MEKFERYLAAVDGSTDWATVQPLFDDAFDDECVFVTADGEMNKQQWAEMAKGLVAKRSAVSDLEISAQGDDTIVYKLTVTPSGGEPMHLAAKGTVRDGRLLRVEPVDPSAYSEMVHRSQ
jgi:hypothetical protein